MKKINYFIICLVLLSTSVTNAQYGIGTDTPSPKAILDLTSTDKGLLIPRMTSAQRTAITTPANALLIFNTSNNSFEVYKSTCSCWVTIYDGGNTPASNLVNTAPVASNLIYTGSFIQGKSITVSYTYEDAQSDPEATTTTVQWQRSATSDMANAITIPNSSATYTFQFDDINQWVRAIVTPRATTGLLNGLTVYGPVQRVEVNTIPAANNLTLTGTPLVGSLLTASYTFSGGSGVEDTTVNGTTYFWQSAKTNTGVDVQNANLYGNSSYTKTYTPQSDLLGRFVRVYVRAKDLAGAQALNSVISPWIGPITASPESAPVASNVTYTPAPGEGLTHTANYTYFDANYDPEGNTTFQWYRADDASGSNAIAISGANAITYVGQSADAGKYIGFGVTPKATTGTITGSEVVFYNNNITTPLATFTFTASDHKQVPFFHANRTMNTLNGIEVEINVTSPGGIVFSSPVVNGYSFTSNLNVVTGIQWITLVPNGTQSAFNSSGDTFTITGLGQSSQSKTLTIYNTRTGNAFTSHFNGITTEVTVNNALSTYTTGEIFSNNTNCQTRPISAGFTAGTCNGSVTVGSNSYPLVLINGQCWFQTNLKEIPIAFSSYTTNSQLAGAVNDMGFWGYYNTTVATGASGWQAAEPAANEGMLYQWSAAMNGATHERAQGVCPTGYHVPSDCEWMYLEHGQGMSISQQNTNGNYRSASNVNQGTPANKLKSAGGNGATNLSGFTSLLTGARDQVGAFVLRNSRVWYWSSTASTATTSINRSMLNTNYGVNRFDNVRSVSMSVRCLKD
jgi:uncharacterized protein (TIGR02145 family)